MTDQTNITQGSIGLVVLGIPGAVLFFGGLYIWLVMAYGFADGMITWETLSAAPRSRLIPFLILMPISPAIGYTMIIFAANMMGIQRYRLQPKHAVLQGLLDTTHLLVVSIILFFLSLTCLPWSAYPLFHPPTLIICGLLTPISWLIRRFAQKKQRKWQSESSNLL